MWMYYSFYVLNTKASLFIQQWILTNNRLYSLVSSRFLTATKYIHKYIYKGHNRVMLEIIVVDKVKCYLDARYISSVEAAWHILEFGMHSEWPSVYHLPIHLPNHQMVVYNPADNVQDVLQWVSTSDTCLTG